MQYTAECQGVFTRRVPFRLRGKIRCGIFSRSLMSKPGGVNLKGWTIHSTVPFPMLEKKDTVIPLSRPPLPPPGDRDAWRVFGLALRLRRGSVACGSEEDVLRGDGGGGTRGGRHLHRKCLRRGAGSPPSSPRGGRVEAVGILLRRGSCHPLLPPPRPEMDRGVRAGSPGVAPPRQQRPPGRPSSRGRGIDQLPRGPARRRRRGRKP